MYVYIEIAVTCKHKCHLISKHASTISIDWKYFIQKDKNIEIEKKCLNSKDRQNIIRWTHRQSDRHTGKQTERHVIRKTDMYVIIPIDT